MFSFDEERPVGNQTIIAEGFLNRLKSSIPELEARVIFDTELSFDRNIWTGKLERVRRGGSFSSKDIPAIYWNRSPVEADPDFAERGRREYRGEIYENSQGKRVVPIYRAYETNIRFAMSFVTNSIQSLESFEVMYLVSMNPLKRFQIKYNFSDEPVNYAIKWSEIQGIDYGDDFVSYTMNFEATVLGTFFVVTGDKKFFDSVEVSANMLYSF